MIKFKKSYVLSKLQMEKIRKLMEAEREKYKDIADIIAESPLDMGVFFEHEIEGDASMGNDKEKKEFKEQLSKLEDAYVEVLGVFHNSKHFQVRKCTNEAVYALNEAILALREALESY